MCWPSGEMATLRSASWMERNCSGSGTISKRAGRAPSRAVGLVTGPHRQCGEQGTTNHRRNAPPCTEARGGWNWPPPADPSCPGSCRQSAAARRRWPAAAASDPSSGIWPAAAVPPPALAGSRCQSGSLLRTAASVSVTSSPRKRHLPGHHLEEHAAERPDVRSACRPIGPWPAREPYTRRFRGLCRRGSSPHS